MTYKRHDYDAISQNYDIVSHIYKMNRQYYDLKSRNNDIRTWLWYDSQNYDIY